MNSESIEKSLKPVSLSIKKTFREIRLFASKKASLKKRKMPKKGLSKLLILLSIMISEKRCFVGTASDSGSTTGCSIEINIGNSALSDARFVLIVRRFFSGELFLSKNGSNKSLDLPNIGFNI